MYEVNVVVGRDPFQQGVLVQGAQLVPPHVRNGPTGLCPQTAHAVRKDPEAIGRTFLRAAEQQLHPQTDAEHRLCQGGQHSGDSGLAQALHCVRGRSHAGQNDSGRGRDHPRLGRNVRARAEPFAGVLQRGEIGAAAIDDDRFHYSTPLVLGSSSPSRRNACRKARPTALKQPSTM